MRTLLWRVAALIREHPALFLPYVTADLLAILFWRLRGQAERVIFHWYATGRLVVGVDVTTPRLSPGLFAKAALTYTPIGITAIVAVMWLSVAALVGTSIMVHSFEDAQRPDPRVVLAEVAQRWRRILIFALRLLITSVVFIAGTVGLAYYLLYLANHQELAFSFWLMIAVMPIGTGCTAWLVLPAAMRLVSREAGVVVSTKTKQLGTIVAVLAVEAGGILGYLLPTLEGRMLLNSEEARTAVSVVSSLVRDSPNALLFIGLTLLAATAAGQESPEIEG